MKKDEKKMIEFNKENDLENKKSIYKNTNDTSNNSDSDGSNEIKCLKYTMDLENEKSFKNK